jgi:hypothetical protein
MTTGWLGADRAGPAGLGVWSVICLTGSRVTGFNGTGRVVRAEIGITPVESSGTITRIPAISASTVNAVAIGQRLRRRAVDEDSSSVSPNICLTSNEVIGHRSVDEMFREREK